MFLFPSSSSPSASSSHVHLHATEQKTTGWSENNPHGRRILSGNKWGWSSPAAPKVVEVPRMPQSPPPQLPKSDHVDSDPTSSFTLDTTTDFDFCVDPGEISKDEHSTADELFSDGKILPIPIHHKNQGRICPSVPVPARALPHSPAVPQRPISRRGCETLKEVISRPQDEEGDDNHKPAIHAKAPSPFWRFGRSTSLKVVGGGTGGGIFSSLHILSRSKSTGSNLHPEYQRQSSVTTRRRRNSCSGLDSYHKPGNRNFINSSAISSRSSCYYRPFRYHGDVGVRPVLNFSPLNILPKGRSSSGLFSHLLCTGKERRGCKMPMSSRRKSA